MLCVYNPLAKEISKRLSVDLYYTGLTDTVRVVDASENETSLSLDRKFHVDLDVTVPGQGMSWYLFQ